MAGMHWTRIARASAVALAIAGAVGGAASRVQAQKASTEGGTHDGIKVHGHWTIDVRNPDGTLVTHREFENALVHGDALLTGWLTRSSVPGAWEIALKGYGTHLCQSFGGECFLDEPSSPTTGEATATSKTLAVTAGVLPSSLSPTVVLSGTATAAFSSSIGEVWTSNSPCPFPPQPCGVGLGYQVFTATQLSPTIPVAEGQIIQVKVVLSFS